MHAARPARRPLITSVASAANLAEANSLGFTVPNPFASATYYASNTVYQYYLPFPQYSGVSDTTSFVGNENWNALEISLRQRPTHGLNFMLNYTYSKSIDDLGTFRVGDNDRLDRSLSTADDAAEPGRHGGLSTANRSRPYVGRQPDLSGDRQ